MNNDNWNFVSGGTTNKVQMKVAGLAVNDGT
jgi:hypothetical protein